MIYEDIKNSVVRTVKRIYPDIYVFSEQISKTKDNPKIKDWVFVGLRPPPAQPPDHITQTMLYYWTLPLIWTAEKTQAIGNGRQTGSATAPIVRFVTVLSRWKMWYTH